jgi:hypothetical protein
MRFQAVIRVEVPGAARRTTNAADFWRAFRTWVGGVAPAPEPLPSDGYWSLPETESRLWSNFGPSLANYLRGHFNDITVILKQVHYRSLELSLDLLSNAFDTLGITNDEILDLLVLYTPTALTQSTMSLTPPGVSPPLQVTANGKMVAATAPAAVPEGGAAQSRIERMWWISNLSLVIPALLLIGGAVLIFQNAGEERRKLTDALVQERSAISDQRQKMLDRYETQLKAYDENMSAQSRHFRDVYQLEIELLKGRAEQIKKGQ